MPSPDLVRRGRSLTGCEVNHADSRAHLHANHSPLCGFQALVDTALESSASALSIAMTKSIRELRSGEWLVCKSELESAGVSTGPFTLLPLQLAQVKDEVPDPAFRRLTTLPEG